MTKFIAFLRYEFLQQNTIYHIFAYNFQLIIMIILTMRFLQPQNNSEFLGQVLIIALPLMILATVKSIIKNDLKDGTLDLLMTNIQPANIILAKYLITLFNIFLAILVAIPLIYFFFGLSISFFINYLSILALICFFVIALAILVDVIESYFIKSSYLGALIITPLLLPIIILSGMSLINEAESLFYLKLIIGLDLFLVPILLSMATILISSINEF